MGVNFEEKFLIFLVPFTDTSVAYYPSAQGGGMIPRPIFKGSDRWMKLVRDDILKISTTKVGKLLLNSFFTLGQVITVRPKEADDCNSVAWEGETISNKNNVQFGTGADLQYNPDTYAVGSKCEARHLRMGGFHIESNETLFHELIHVFRYLTGKNNRMALGKGLSFYENSEEFYAVLMQGIYASERRLPIRSSHFHHYEIDKELNTSINFFKTSADTFTWVEKFCLDHPQFTKDLAKINVGFNPIKAYYEKGQQIKQMLKSETAQRRDKFMPLAKATIDFLSKMFR